MAKIVCFPRVSGYNAARDRSFFVDLSRVKGSPFFIPIFTFSHNSHSYSGHPNNNFHYSIFHVLTEDADKKFHPHIRQAIINGEVLSDFDLDTIDNNYVHKFRGRPYHENVFFVKSSSDLEEALSLMQETNPLQNDEEVRQTVLEYVTPFLDFSLEPIRFPHVLL